MIILQFDAAKMFCLKLRKSECRTSLFMTFGLWSPVTGEGGLGEEKDIAQVSSVCKGAALSGSLWCGKRKNVALVYVDNPVLTLNISTEIKWRVGEEKEIIEACQIIFCWFYPWKEKQTHTTPAEKKPKQLKTKPQIKTKKTSCKWKVKLWFQKSEEICRERPLRREFYLFFPVHFGFPLFYLVLVLCTFCHVTLLRNK